MQIGFWRRLDILLQHKLPLISALELLQKESRNTQEKIFVSQVITRLKAGESFSAAASSGSEQGLLAAGEKAADLPAAIRRLADRYEYTQRIRTQIFSATLYPLFILVLAFVLLFIISTLVLPRFQKLFISLGVGGNLPLITRWLVGYAHFLQTWGVWVFLLVGVALYFVYRRYRGVVLSSFLWRLPFLGQLWKTSHRERLFSSLGLLLNSGVPLDAALQQAALAVSGTPLYQVATQGAQRLSQGDRLSVVLRASGCFEESHLQVVALAEQGAGLGDSLLHLSSLLGEQLQFQLKSVVTLLEPVLILAMAGLVSFMVVALFLPLGPLISRLGTGA